MRLSGRLVRMNNLNGRAKRNQQHADDSDDGRLEFNYARFGLRFEHAIQNIVGPEKAGSATNWTPLHIILLAITPRTREAVHPKCGERSSPWMNPELIEFPGEIQQFSCLNGSRGPLHQRPVLIEFSDLRQPLRACFRIDCDNVRQVAWPQTPANRKLKTLQEPTPAPLILQPFHGNFRAPFLRRATTAAFADN